MATAAKLGKGTLLKRGDGASPEQFNTILEMLDIPDAPSSDRDLIDVTNHDSSGTEREYILGLSDGNEIQGRCNYTNTTQQNGLRTDKANGTARHFKLTFPQYSPDITCAFTGLVRAWTLSPPVDGQITLSFTIKVTGTPVWS